MFSLFITSVHNLLITTIKIIWRMTYQYSIFATWVTTQTTKQLLSDLWNTETFSRLNQMMIPDFRSRIRFVQMINGLKAWPVWPIRRKLEQKNRKSFMVKIICRFIGQRKSDSDKYGRLKKRNLSPQIDKPGNQEWEIKSWWCSTKRLKVAEQSDLITV